MHSRIMSFERTYMFDVPIDCKSDDILRASISCMQDNAIIHFDYRRSVARVRIAYT